MGLSWIKSTYVSAVIVLLAASNALRTGSSVFPESWGFWVEAPAISFVVAMYDFGAIAVHSTTRPNIPKKIETKARLRRHSVLKAEDTSVSPDGSGGAVG